MKYTLHFQEPNPKTGERLILVVLRQGDNRTKISTGVTSTVKFEGRTIPRTVRNSAAKNIALSAFLNKLEEYIILHPDASLYEVKEAVSNRKSMPGRKNLASCIMEFGETQRKQSTRLLYKATSDKVRKFAPAITFSNADVDWLKRFERHCLKDLHLSINGTAKELRNIRATFNWALDHELTEKYPFRRFKIRHERTRKRSLTVEQLRELINYKVDVWHEEYRDMFLLIFYLIGINISDLLELKSLTDGRCVYHRNKTGRLYDIAVQPEAAALIEKYRGEKHLLRPLDHAVSINGYTRRMNDALKSIGESHKAIQVDEKGNPVKRKDGRTKWHIKKEPLFPDLSTYWARHTWATIAASLDIPKETISKALGHADEKTADIYIDFDMRKVDEANRKVIDWVLYGKK